MARYVEQEQWLTGRLQTMPADWYNLVNSIIDSIRRANPASILEIGVGLGKYGVAIRHALDDPRGRQQSGNWRLRLDGVELSSGAQPSQHKYIYDNGYDSEALKSTDDLPRYDVVFLGDALCYFDKRQGRKLVERLLKKTNTVLILYSPRLEAGAKDPASPAVPAYRSRWWELDFVDFDATSFTVDAGDASYIVFQVYPSRGQQQSVREGTGIQDEPTTVEAPRRPLNIAYFLPHKSLTGGVKTALEQLEQLRKLGHKVTVVFEGQDDERALPPWTDFAPDEEIVVRNQQERRRRLQRFDVVMVGWVAQLPKLLGVDVPVLYWEKGYEWLFGDLGDDGAKSEDVRKYLASCYSLPFEIISASHIIAHLLATRYGRVTTVVPEGVDVTKFYPAAQKPARETKTILLVGYPTLPFKGFDVAFAALRKVWEAGLRFNVRWVCQRPPQGRDVPFPLEVVVNPPQDELPRIYREAHMLLFASWYEGFGMPPLEAMASGVPVVATNFGGGAEYMVPGVNALVADPGDVDALALGVAHLLRSEGIRDYLASQGRKTAEKFDIRSSVQLLERQLLIVAAKRAS